MQNELKAVEIGERLAALRGKRTQRELARDAGVDVGTVSRIERGEIDPTLGTLKKLANALGRPLADLVSEEQPTASAPPIDADVFSRLDALEGDMRLVVERGEDVDGAVLEILGVLARSEIVRKPDASRLQRLLDQLQSRRHE